MPNTLMVDVAISAMMEEHRIWNPQFEGSYLVRVAGDQVTVVNVRRLPQGARQLFPYGAVVKPVEQDLLPAPKFEVIALSERSYLASVKALVAHEFKRCWEWVVDVAKAIESRDDANLALQRCHDMTVIAKAHGFEAELRELMLCPN